MNSPVVSPTENHISGIWKFSDRVSIADLITFAQELIAEGKEKYLHVEVRKCSKDQNGICFLCIPVWNAFESSERLSNRLFEERKDKMYRRFGTGFVGWDVSPEVYVVDLNQEASCENK